MNPPLPTPSPPPLAPPNIYIVGAQCTGKTTLVANLHAHFTTADPHNPKAPPVRVITDVARTVLRAHNFTARDVRIPARSLALQRLVLQAQAAAERDVVIGAGPGGWFISDRSGADPIAYAMQYIGAEGVRALAESEQWGVLKRRMQEAVVVVCEVGPGVAGWLTDDGVRLMPEDLEEWVGFHRVFCEFLEGEGVRCEVLSAEVSGHEERVEFVLGRWRERWRERG
ncbi:AAA domain-containing protein [Parachaetomium inaequale]|uniref:AAA domain-containing protein n=1 Tax=Parachaetomium inaequale TaxID=2588326 RepID=A0AAN6SUY5_9PEZI|nr:AAA domain-containing protein [Parachaetomium inaequale]